MNRVIKFRAWDGEQMIKFDNHAYTLSYNDISGWNVAPNTPNYDGNWTMGESADSKIFELMQFTGLLDSKGTEIYEGDIMSGWRQGSNSDRGYTGVIEWRTEQAGWIIKCHTFILEILSLAMSGDESHTNLLSFAVIGNRFANPELLQP